jgi:hypothetical protein
MKLGPLPDAMEPDIGTDGARHGKVQYCDCWSATRERDSREEINLELLAWLGL